MKTFRQWLSEMVGTGAIWDGTKSPDFQWWGDPSSAINPKPKKKKRKGKSK
jgi:hypothetical protein